MKRYLILLVLAAVCCNGHLLAQSADWRDIANGYPIYSNSYIDQPYVSVLKDGRWLCVFTTGAESESRPGQHVVSITSYDKGKTWTAPVSIEPNTGPISSWAIPYVTPYGRVYVFYNYNGDNVAELNGKPVRQAGLLGWYCFKYSDDNGRTWSAQRYRIPVRVTAVDAANDFKGKVQMFWGIDKPRQIGDTVLFIFSKLGVFPQGMGEGWLLRSSNLAVERDAGKVQWQMLPEGNHGIRNPALGSVQEEHNIVPLNNGGLYCILRTAMGFVASTVSHDLGRTWTLPQPAAYAPASDQLIKNPRACPRLFKCSNGKYLLWFHHHGGTNFKERNPVWITGGVEKNGQIYWSQPEILLYTNNLAVNGMSYPDLVEEKGQYWITETQKSEAKVHAIDPSLLEGMWQQALSKSEVTRGLVFRKRNPRPNSTHALSGTPKNGGLTIDLWLTLHSLTPGQLIADSRNPAGQGFWITTDSANTLRLHLSDGSITESWKTDAGALTEGKQSNVVFIVDGLPGIISGLVNGRLCDGGKDRQFGWARFSAKMNGLPGGKTALKLPRFNGSIANIRIYDRYLRTSEAVSNYNHGL
jgi:hypothetical protein